jgi:hypothetical protein
LLQAAAADVHLNSVAAAAVQVVIALQHFHCLQTFHTPAQLEQVGLLHQMAAIPYFQQLPAPVAVKAGIQHRMAAQAVQAVELVTADRLIVLVVQVIHQAHRHHKVSEAETTQVAQVMCRTDPVAAAEQVRKVETWTRQAIHCNQMAVMDQHRASQEHL